MTFYVFELLHTFAVRGLSRVGSRNHVLDGVQISQRKKAILAVVRPTEKALGVLAVVYTQKRLNR